MSLRLKIILGMLVVAAGFFVARVGVVLNNGIQSSNIIANISGATAGGIFKDEDPMTKDTDHDGLSDRDEIIYGTDPFKPDTDGDGYKDGEEIVSNTDPLNSSDNHKARTDGTNSKSLSLISPTANLTDRVLNMGLASMVNDSGNLDPAQMNNKKFADILTSVNQEAIMYLSPPPVTDKDILIIDDNSPEIVKKYVDTLSSIIEDGMFNPGLTETSVDLFETSFMNYYENKYNALKLIQVPSSWKETHKTTLTNLKTIANCVTALTTSSIDADPVKASYALNLMQSSLVAMVDVLSSMTKKAMAQNIPVDSIMQLFQALNTSASSK